MLSDKYIVKSKDKPLIEFEIIEKNLLVKIKESKVFQKQKESTKNIDFER